MTEVPGGARRRHLTRRELLAAGGGLAAAGGGGVLAGCAHILSSGGHAQSRSSGEDGQVRRFRSRPDLQPVSVVVRSDRGGTAPGLIFVGPYDNRAGQQGPMIVDNRGELVWFKPLSSGASKKLRPFNVRVQRYRGEDVLTWFEGTIASGHGQGSYVIADSSYRQIHRVHAGHGYAGDLHEFLITDSGTALFTCYVRGTADLSAISGPAEAAIFDGVVQEVDIATGRVLFQWRASEHIDFADSHARVPDHGGTWDPYHLNSIDVDSDQNLIISSRHTWAVYKVERRSGRVLWRLGGKNSDFTLGPGARFAWQHDVRPHPAGRLTVFDNEAGLGPAASGQSRGLVLEVDESKRRATLLHDYLHPSPKVLSAALGSVQLLPGGHVFMGWGKPYVTEYHPDGTVIYDAELQGGGTRSYRAFRSQWTGRPAGRPALAVDALPHGTELAVSWNGDTEVRRWKVLAGNSPGRLTAVATSAREGFETRIRISRRARYVAVAGLDGSGRELGRTTPHPVPSG